MPSLFTRLLYEIRESRRSVALVIVLLTLALLHNLDGSRIGMVHFPISCSKTAQDHFNNALALLHSFSPDANERFKQIVEAEPTCSMAYWGIAMSNRPNPLTPPFSPDELRQGLEAAAKARTVAQSTPREQEWIQAISEFYDNYDTVNQNTRTQNYERAMERLHKHYPEDVEAAAFYALSLNEAAAYSDRDSSKQLKAASILENFRAIYPDHPGILHYLIHTYDHPELAHLGLSAASAYEKVASSIPHAIHMPAHIYSMLGMWHDVIRTEIRADAAVKISSFRNNPFIGLIQAANPSRYHSLDFLTNAYLQIGQDRLAQQIVAMVASVGEISPDARYTAHMAFAAIPVRYVFERGEWNEAASLAYFNTPYPQAEAVICFGRALGAARRLDTANAQKELAHLRRIEDRLSHNHEAYWEAQVRMMENAVTAWTELLEGRNEVAIERMQKAVALEESTPKNIAMENSLLPMKELLGELFLQIGEPAIAMRAFEASLQTSPNRFRSLAGLISAAYKLADAENLLKFSERLVSLGDRAETIRPELIKARKLVLSR